VLVAVLGATPAVGEAGGDQEPVPVEILGVSYAFSAYANTVRGTAAQLGVSRLRASGDLEPNAPATIRITGSLRPPSGPPVTITAAGTTWTVDYLEPVSTLVINLRVLTTSDSSVCRAGANGSVTVVDNDRRLANGRSRDSLRLRFNGGACRALARAWTNATSKATAPATGGQRANVEILLETAPARRAG
jgi:hypothetical protein